MTYNDMLHSEIDYLRAQVKRLGEHIDRLEGEKKYAKEARKEMGSSRPRWEDNPWHSSDTGESVEATTYYRDAEAAIRGLEGRCDRDLDEDDKLWGEEWET